MLYRRFGFVQSRVLLHKQDELRRLGELDFLDDLHARSDPAVLISRERDDVKSGQRKIILAEMEE